MTTDIEPGWTAERVKDYVDAVLTEKDRALKMSDDEREKAAAALRDERNRAEDRAATERASAAAELRDRIAQGDKSSQEAIGALAREVAIATTYGEKAIDKADRATEIRFNSFNEFNKRINLLTATFPSREVVDSIVDAITSRLAKVETTQASERGAGNRSALLVTYLLSGLAILVSVAVGVILVVKG